LSIENTRDAQTLLVK